MALTSRSPKKTGERAEEKAFCSQNKPKKYRARATTYKNRAPTPSAPYSQNAIHCPPGTEKCPLLVSDVLLSHGLTPQYHRRSGA